MCFSVFSKEESDIDFVMSIVQILKGSSFVKILTELQKVYSTEDISNISLITQILLNLY